MNINSLSLTLLANVDYFLFFLSVLKLYNPGSTAPSFLKKTDLFCKTI